TGLPPWGSQPGSPADNDADGIADATSILDRNNRGAIAAYFDNFNPGTNASYYNQQLPGDAWSEGSCPFAIKNPPPCNIYTQDCGALAHFPSHTTVAGTTSPGSPIAGYVPYPVGPIPPSQSDWPVVPFPRDWAPFSASDASSVPAIKKLLRFSSSIVSF